ncbi:HOP1 [Symbiodinium sp. CCMP2592]|nr:HOP1 [Symbiodinium sp. CCMP2592]
MGDKPVLTGIVKRRQQMLRYQLQLLHSTAAHNTIADATGEAVKMTTSANYFEGNHRMQSNSFCVNTRRVRRNLSYHTDGAPDLGAVWANRAQCWLKMGDHEKACADAEKCTEVEPMNPKGWFRKGISLHAMQRYAEAIPALLEAEKLEPSNKQILDAIKMAQLMARKSA